MIDTALTYDEARNAFDIAIDGSGLAIDDGLRTAVIVSLFTDARVDANEVTPGTDRRGYWADRHTYTTDHITGSRLWLLAGEKQLDEVLNRAREYAQNALQWLIDDRIARAVTVTAEIVRDGVLGIGIEIARTDHPVTRYRFERFWSGD